MNVSKTLLSILILTYCVSALKLIGYNESFKQNDADKIIEQVHSLLKHYEYVALVDNNIILTTYASSVDNFHYRNSSNQTELLTCCTCWGECCECCC